MMDVIISQRWTPIEHLYILYNIFLLYTCHLSYIYVAMLSHCQTGRFSLVFTMLDVILTDYTSIVPINAI